jgi:hypothetical protein
MTQHQAGRIANRIYAELAARTITRRTALKQLEPIQHALSTSQFYRLMDLQDACYANPWLLDA